MKINLLVLRCKNLETSKTFYEQLGLIFIKEKHGKGVEHYSTYVGELVLELYPKIGEDKIENSRLGFTLESQYFKNIQNDVVSRYNFNGNSVVVVQDPDGRKVELLEG